jgi:hypothetical protein
VPRSTLERRRSRPGTMPCGRSRRRDSRSRWRASRAESSGSGSVGRFCAVRSIGSSGKRASDAGRSPDAWRSPDSGRSRDSEKEVTPERAPAPSAAGAADHAARWGAAGMYYTGLPVGDGRLRCATALRRPCRGRRSAPWRRSREPTGRRRRRSTGTGRCDRRGRKWVGGSVYAKNHTHGAAHIHGARVRAGRATFDCSRGACPGGAWPVLTHRT